MKRFLLSCMLAGLSIALSAAPVRADIIYVGDEEGNIGRWDTSTNSGAFVGSVSTGFTVGQVLGITYHAASNSIVILDRGGSRVYTMNAITGIVTAFFPTGSQFEGGAFSGGVLYGINEATQRLNAFTYPAGASIPVGGPALTSHTHALGEDASGTMYTIGTNGNINIMNTDGTLGSFITNSIGTFVDDIDYYSGNFLATEAGPDTLALINGVTGARSTFLTAAQINSMGVAGSSLLTGVTIIDVPEPMGITLFGMGACGLAGYNLWRRRKLSVA